MFVIPIRTRSHLNARGAWYARHQRIKREREATYAAWLHSGRLGLELPAVVRLTRVAPRKLDEGDNLPSAMKGIRDELAKLWGLPDDSPDQAVRWVYAQRRGLPRQYAVLVEWWRDPVST